MSVITIDKGLKEKDCYEYWPVLKHIEGSRYIPSFDIGNKHFSVYIRGQNPSRCRYAAVWKLGEKMTAVLQERLTFLLTRLHPFLSNCSTVLIEQQQASNYMAVRLQQHLLSFLELRYPSIVRVNVSASIKYTRLDGPLGDQAHKRKGWAVEKACEIAEEEEDLGVVRIIRELERLKKEEKELNLKGDDIADSSLQYQAWCTQQKKGVVW